MYRNSGKEVQTYHRLLDSLLSRATERPGHCPTILPRFLASLEAWRVLTCLLKPAGIIISPLPNWQSRHQSLQEASALRRDKELGRRTWPLFLLWFLLWGLHKAVAKLWVRNFPLCRQAFKSLATGTGRCIWNPRHCLPRMDVRPTTETIQRQTHLNFLLTKCFLGPQLQKAMLNILEK